MKGRFTTLNKPVVVQTSHRFAVLLLGSFLDSRSSGSDGLVTTIDARIDINSLNWLFGGSSRTTLKSNKTVF